MVVKHPVSQTVNYESPYYRVIAVECVSAARIVHVIFFVAVYKHVIYTVFKSPEADCNSMLVTFCRMVEYYIKNYFYAGFVKFFYKPFEFRNDSARSLVCCKSCFRGKKCGCAVAPVIFHPFTGTGVDVSVFKFIKLKYWHKF